MLKNHAVSEDNYIKLDKISNFLMKYYYNNNSKYNSVYYGTSTSSINNNRYSMEYTFYLENLCAPIFSFLNPNSKVGVAGGFFRSIFEGNDVEKLNDIDIYFFSEEDYEYFIGNIRTWINTHNLNSTLEASCFEADNLSAKSDIFSTEKLKSVTQISSLEILIPNTNMVVKYQFIFIKAVVCDKNNCILQEIKYNSISDIINSFDFACCMYGVEFNISDNKIVLEREVEGTNFSYSISSKNLILNNDGLFVSRPSLKRLYKYIKKYGYSLDEENLERLSSIGLSKKDYNDYIS